MIFRRSGVVVAGALVGLTVSCGSAGSSTLAPTLAEPSSGDSSTAAPTTGAAPSAPAGSASGSPSAGGSSAVPSGRTPGVTKAASASTSPTVVTPSSTRGRSTAAAPQVGPVSFRGDWESGSVTGSGAGNWSDLEVVAPDRFTLVRDATRAGTVARIEVRPGDNPLSFCCEGTSRAEVSGLQDAGSHPVHENASSGTQRITVSVKFDKDWRTVTDTGDGAWGIFVQLHGPNASNPAFALSATDQIRLNLRGGSLATSTVVEYALKDGSLTPGRWIDFVLTIRFAADRTGSFRIERRNEGAVGFTTVLDLTGVATLQYDPAVNGGAVGNHYWKHGFYRNDLPFTSVLYVDGFTRQRVGG